VDWICFCVRFANIRMYSVGFLVTSLLLAKLMEKLGRKLLHVSALLLLSIGHMGILVCHYFIKEL